MTMVINEFTMFPIGKGEFQTCTVMLPGTPWILDVKMVDDIFTGYAVTTTLFLFLPVRRAVGNK